MISRPYSEVLKVPNNTRKHTFTDFLYIKSNLFIQSSYHYKSTYQTVGLMPDTRDHILATAFKLFFEKGYKEVTMSQLVQATGLSKGAFYHYFSSKEELYNVTLEKYIGSYLHNFQLDYNDHLSLRENLINLFSRFAYITTEFKDTMNNQEFGLANYFLFLQSAMKNTDFRQKLDQYNRQFITEFIRWIDRAKEKKEIDQTIDSSILARHLASLMKGMTVLHSYGDGMEPLEVTFDQIINQFFNYLERKNQ